MKAKRRSRPPLGSISCTTCSRLNRSSPCSRTVSRLTFPCETSTSLVVPPECTMTFQIKQRLAQAMNAYGLSIFEAIAKPTVP